MQVQVMPVHFEDFSGKEFERLVFAYHARAGRWDRLDWYGQVGGDLGRDIWGVEAPSGRSVCIACANFQRLKFEKAGSDIDKIVAAPFGMPDLLRVVTGGSVSAKMRSRILAHATKRGIPRAELWSGTELEECLRRDAESLLKRFCGGVPFPDDAPDLRLMAAIGEPKTDPERFDLLARVFDRPAFQTPICQEGSLPHFRKAISDTIQALNTGCWQTRDGMQLGRVPRRDEIEDLKARAHLAKCVEHLTKLRAAYDELIRKGELSPCASGQEDYGFMMMSERAAATLSRHRNAAVAAALAACPTLPLQELPGRWPNLLDEDGKDDV